MKILKPLLAGLLALCALAASELPATGADQYLMYIGTYTGAKSKGIYVARFDAATGKATTPELAAETVNPTFVTVHPNQHFLYAANEIGNFAGTKSGAVSAFMIDAETGKLKPLNQKTSGGNGPCHVSVDATGKNVLVANYGGGSIEVLPINADGSLGEPTAFIQHAGSSVNKQRQEGPHAHFITTDPANRFALACDLGLDKVFVYRLDAAKGTLTPNDPPAADLAPGAGPRHFAFHPKGHWVYVINKLASTMTVFEWNAQHGAMKEVQTITTLPEDFKGRSSTAEVQVHPSGKFVYGSNRGHESIVVFAVDEHTGRLTSVQHQSTQGKMPRHFTLDPSARWLVAENQQTDNISIFSVDQSTGRLTPTGQILEAGAPVCAQFVPVK